ncbi:MAG: alpha/beta hydrolase [Verrucomicrobia bacterium]|nr:alpha/beta hydrolase [Verrucomicrobiota bacterium]
MRTPRIFPWAMFLCLAFYLAACVFLFLLQRRIIYQPPVLTPAQEDQMAAAGRLDIWTNAAGDCIGVKRLSPRQPALGSVLVLHGNADDAAGAGYYADSIQMIAAFNVFIVEYPGYGDRPGTPTEASLFQAADGAFQLLDTNRPIYLVGESLGTGVAAYLAGAHLHQVAGVVLLSPFDRLADVAQYHYPIFPARWLLLDRFPSENYLRQYRGPVGMVVDGHDDVVPEESSFRLYNACAGPKRLWKFAQGGHIQIMEPSAEFWRQVVGFWQTNGKRRMKDSL